VPCSAGFDAYYYAPKASERARFTPEQASMIQWASSRCQVYLLCNWRKELPLALHGHRLRAPATNTTNGQAHNNSTTNLPHRNARAQHLDMSRCWDAANFCPLVVSVGGVRIAGVRSRCPCSGVWLLFLTELLFSLSAFGRCFNTDINYLRRRLASGEGIAWLNVTQCVCVCLSSR